MSDEVKIRAEDNKPVCPVCHKPGNFHGAGGQACNESEWIWDEQIGKLIAVPKR